MAKARKIKPTLVGRIGAPTNLRPAGAHKDVHRDEDMRQAVKAKLRRGDWE